MSIYLESIIMLYMRKQSVYKFQMVQVFSLWGELLSAIKTYV